MTVAVDMQLSRLQRAAAWAQAWIAGGASFERPHFLQPLDVTEPDSIQTDEPSEVAAEAALREGPSPCMPVADESQLRAWIDLIVRQDRAGEAALAALYAACSRRVFSLAMRFTRDAACADEVTEDVFWQVWRQAPRFDPARGNAMAWLLTMARSRALDAVRARTRDPLDHLDPEALALAQAQHEGGVAPGDLLHQVQAGSALHMALNALQPLPRQLISLAFFRGLTHEEIAEQMNIPLGTVKSHVRRALAALRAVLGADLDPRGA